MAENSNMQFRNSIALRYFLATASVLIIGQLIFSVFILYTNFRQQQNDLHHWSIEHVNFLSQVTPDDILSNNFYSIENLMQETSSDDQFVYSLVTHVDGRVLTNFLDARDSRVQLAIANAEEPNTLSRVNYISSLNGIVEVQSDIFADDLLIGQVRLGYHTDSLYSRLWGNIITTLVLSGLLSLLLAVVTIALFNIQIRNPLRDLGILAHQFAMGEFDKRSEAIGNNEISQLQTAFNDMASQLQDNIDEMEKLSQVASRTKNAVVIADPQGRIEWVNEAFFTITGYTLQEAKGHTPGSLLQGEKSDFKTVEFMRENLRKGEGFHVEIINYHKLGYEYWIDVEVRPVLDEDGNIKNFIAIETDITERKEAQESLEKYAEDMAQANWELSMQQARLQSLLRIVTQSVDTETQLAGVVQSGIESYAMQFGCIVQSTDSEFSLLAQSSLNDSFQFQDTYSKQNGLLNETFNSATTTTRNDTSTTSFCGQSDQVRSFIGTQFLVNGQPYGVLCFFSDDYRLQPFVESDFDFIQIMAQWVSVTIERQLSRDELDAYASELERSNRELQDFAYISSHDLQEPLRKIQAFGSRVESRYADILDERGIDYLQRIQSAAHRMQNLINDLLSFSRVTTKAKDFQSVDLNETLANILLDLEIRINETQGQIQMEGELPTIEAEPHHMRQIFQNIVGNALKFKHPDRNPVVKVSSQIQEMKGREVVVIQIADNGIGFDEKYADKIFTIFQRLHSKLEYEGTGIGLAVCRRIVEYHNGKISVASQKDIGTTFTIELPMQQISNKVAT